MNSISQLSHEGEFERAWADPSNTRFELPPVDAGVDFIPRAPTQVPQSFFYGPVCIDSRHRGGGLLRKLYYALLHEVAGIYEIGVAFVAEDNQNSLRAHVNRLNMEVVGDFEFRGRRNYLLTLRCSDRP